MKLNKIMLAAAVAFGLSSTAYADQGHGKVTFTGAIIDAPCSISPESIDQTVEMGQISKVALQNGGKSTPRNFSIDLENCSFEAGNNKVTATFTGMESESGLLGIHGSASGAGIAITDGAGTVIELGQPTKEQELQAGNNTLSFAAYVQGEAASDIIEGDFQAVADFTLAYN
ncbi:fimbrial protein [Serratia marcescens]|nr:fimbrial protein [Serratia marcescens]